MELFCMSLGWQIPDSTWVKTYRTVHHRMHFNICKDLTCKGSWGL